MNRLNYQLKSALQFFVSIVGTTIIASIFGILGGLIYKDIGIALFVIIYIIGIAGSIKLYLTPQPTSELFL